MITVNTLDIFTSDNSVHIGLSNGKRYKILLKDYENLPFECKSDSMLENIFIDVSKIGLYDTNKYFDGDCVGFLSFLSQKYSIYNAAVSKVAMTDIPKRMLRTKLFVTYTKYLKKYNEYKTPENQIEIDTDTMKSLCITVCDEFEQLGYIDDKRYAFDKAKYLKEYKKYGNEKIKNYLFTKSIPRDIILEVMDDEFFHDEDTDNENMKNLLVKKYGENLHKLNRDKKDIIKAINMLIRNGYRFPEAKTAVFDILLDRKNDGNNENSGNNNNNENESDEDNGENE